MREIKFRAWDEKRKSMLYDFNMLYLSKPYAIGKRVNSGCWESYATNEYGQSNTIILMQFTGLKDKNGKEIYEGDVMSYSGSKCLECGAKQFYEGHGKYQIEWGGGVEVGFGCYEINGDNYMSADIWGTDMEVIGNIYKNVVF